MNFLVGAVVTLVLLLCTFFIFMRRQSKKIGDLKHENRAIKKKIEMQKEDEEFKARVIAIEQEEILKGLDDAKKKSKLDRLNDV